MLDANVFVAAAFKRRSASARLLDQVRERRLALVWNDATRAATRAVLRRIYKPLIPTAPL